MTFCEENVPDSEGPYSIIYRRVVDSDGPLSDWERVGPTCHTPSVPAQSGDTEELTDAMILEQFHRTDFALPQLIIEPPGQTVAVNLPAYFELVWPEDGFEPGEVDATELAGHQVRIRPVFNEATYHFGDGDSAGPTTSQGGGFPDGDITHAYESTGEIAPSVTVVYGGEVSVDGDDWMTIPGTVEIEGPATEITVVTSRNRLYGD
ncbi:hypothetical protein [Ornithinicoccus halotolerans]|uniref:hypothetical protein n=1 Tax=Ornithinicoccus halotolerans TaxID=1748220 RepID=UPI001294C59C|nr:hypothetical protein [Ornithinicoccus halotolerans]